MKKSILLCVLWYCLLWNNELYSQKIYYKYNAQISKKQNRKAQDAIAKLGAFYHWYLMFFQKEKYTPLQHIVYKQYISPRLRSLLIATESPDDFFWQGKAPIQPFDLIIQTQKEDNDFIVAYTYISNDTTWFLRHELLTIRNNIYINRIERISK